MNQVTATLVNRVLLFLAALLAGTIVGYALGETDVTRPATAGGRGVPLNVVLAPEHTWIVEGFNCPMPNCTNPLAVCSGQLAREIRHWINAQLQAGRPGASIREEIVRVHGRNLFKTGVNAPLLEELHPESPDTSASSEH